jgi:GH35 family endo-1,4-beta-xylanase
VCIPLNQTRRFFVQRTIPNFGSIVLTTDNVGEGYTASAQGGTVLNLSHELARTQINRLRDNLDAYQAAGYKIPPAIDGELVKAESLLSQAGSQTGAQQAALSDQATSKALWALENMELVCAEQDIPRYRTGGLTVTVLDAAGTPLSDATVSYTQTTHDFLFGIFDTLENTGIEGYELMRQAGINYLTTGFYLSETEPEQDQISWDYIDHQIGVLDLAEMGFTLKAHALLALWDFATPDYLKGMSFDEVNKEVYEHISTLVERYQDHIDIWNVINEAHGRSAALNFSREEITTLTQTGIRAIRNYDPDARIIINSAFDWYGESRQMTLMTTGKADDFTLSIPAYLDQLTADGVNYDIIGQQLYNGGYSDIFTQWGLGDPFGIPTWDLAHISALLDQLGEYGQPVHITEQSVPSTWEPGWAQYGAGWSHNHWDEEMQAEYIHDFYTIAFSKERVEAITWWCINDSNSFINTGGLLDEDNNPKQAYFALRDLIDGWMTTGKSVTDSAGQISILGYGGEYDLTVTNGDQVWHGTVHIWEQQASEFKVQIPGN